MAFNSTFRPILSFLSFLAISPSVQRDYYSSNSLKVSHFWKEKYDYIIVGGGTAGSVVARRLAEDSNLKVILIEAGGSENIMHEIPMATYNLRKSSFDWDFPVKTQDVSCYGYDKMRLSMPRGKVLGGSSSMNNMIYTRGNKRDYDEWSEDGIYGWSWEEVFPYFLKSENNADQEVLLNGYHQKGGLVNIEKSPFKSKLSKIWIEAGIYLGYPINDCNGDKQTGFSIPQGFIKKGIRWSTSKAFLETAKNQSNLNIMINTRVTRILFGADQKAIGVQFEKDSIHYVIRAKQEVILSAGAISTPHLLMNSGIGPADHLSKLGIPIISDLRVGDNLQDHITTIGITFSAKGIQTLKTNQIFSTQNFVNYLISNSGPLTSFSGIEGLAFMHSRYSNPSLDWPDILLVLVNSNTLSSNSDYLSSEFKNKLKVNSSDQFTIFPIILKPKSKGIIRLQSSNPLHPPLIDPKYLTHPEDIMVMIDAIKAAIQVGLSPPFESINADLVPIEIEVCDHYNHFSDEYFACWARVLTDTANDPVGTCKMGPEWDKSSVVDAQLKVIGVKGLRIADASVIPRIISGFTNAAAIMIGEKAADLILKRYMQPIPGPLLSSAINKI